MAKKTIYDLAKELNMAPSTISKALNKQKGVNEEKRKFIVDYAKKTGYVPNPTASSLKSKKSSTIGVLYSEASSVGLEHPFFSPVLQHAKTFLENKGYDLIFITSNSKDYQSYAEFCSLRNISGVFVVSVKEGDPLLNGLNDTSNFKIVATDFYDKNIPTILSDNKEGIELVVDYYKKVGFTSVGIITHNKMGPSISFKERYDNYIELCKENNIEVKENDIVEIDHHTYVDAYNRVKAYLKEHKPPQAFFAVSDLIAIATIRALKENGYRVPEDVSVIGFDDIDLDKYLTPSLSTIRQDVKAIGTKAAKVLLKQLNGETIEKTDIRIPVSLILRESTKRID